MIDAAVPKDTIDPDSFRRIADLTYAESGLQLIPEKSSMIQSRLRHRVKALNLSGFCDYSIFVCSEDGRKERRNMISALTTNVSHFFRERHHFEVLATSVAETYLSRLRSGGQLRIWSAGCSNGQEACSIAMTLLEMAPDVADLDLRILATDIDPNVVSFSHEGKYNARLMTGVPEALVEKYFTADCVGEEKTYRVNESVRNLVRYKELNLLSEWPMRRRMDIIFCRNVVIYFDAATQNKLWPRFRSALAPKGYLFLGHSERISDPGAFGFTNGGHTTYRPASN